MREWLSDLFRDRAWWMNGAMVFCAFMTFVYMPWDIFWKPVAHDQEVWFGVMFTGWWAKLTAIPHWIVYGAGFHGLRRRKYWMGVAGAIYVGQIAIGMFLWPILQYGSLLGLVLGVIAAIPFALLTMAFWNARDFFERGAPSLRERYGEWALVTGASSGIGREFARALAAEQVNCVLTARRADRLEALEAELTRQHGVKVRCVAADLAEPDADARIAEAVADLDIAILVNNAGVGYSGRFDGQAIEPLRDMIRLNCIAPVALTSRLLPGMKARGRGAVIVVGSVSGRQPLPLHAVYSATKAFDLHFGEALYVELRGSGVDALVVEPGATQTEFSDVAGQLAHGGETPEQVVAVALSALGGQPSVVSGWWNWVRASLAARIGSRALVAYVARGVMAGQTPAEKL